MADPATKLPVHNDNKAAPSPTPWRPFGDLQREIDRLFEDFGRSGLLRSLRSSSELDPAFRREFSWKAPAVDISETESAYEIKAELPGIEAKSLEVTLRNGNIVIKGEKHEESEEKTKDYYVKERQFGSFQRTFALPEGIDADKIEASCVNGVLSVTLPKTAEAKSTEKRIDIKAA